MYNISRRNWRVCKQGRRGQDRGKHGMAGQGTDQKRTEQKQSRAWGQKTGKGIMGIVQYE